MKTSSGIPMRSGRALHPNVGALVIFLAATFWPLRSPADPPSPDETPREFVNRASRALEAAGRRVELAEFVEGVDGTPEHNEALKAARLEKSQLNVVLWKAALPHSRANASPATVRKIRILRLPPALPAPFDPVLAAEQFTIQGSLENNYTDSQDCRGRFACRTKKQLYDVLDHSRTPSELLSAWTEWHDAGAAIRAPFKRSVELLNIGARDYGFTNVGETLRAQYEMKPDEFAVEYQRLWNQVRPLYESLHCHVRAKLHERYGDLVPEVGPIPAHLLGNMWGQYWQNIDDLIGIPPASTPIDVTDALVKNNFGPTKVVKTAEQFFVSMGFPSLPDKFWSNSVLAPIPGKTVDCHASASPIDPASDDVRLKFCVQTTEQDFRIAHHELGHIYYYLAYAKQPYLFQDGANAGFHEALGDTLGLSVTPAYLEKIGLAPKGASTGTDDLNSLMRVALEKLPALAMSMTVDQWRWKVYSGEITPDRYNRGWWKQVLEYQGLSPPISRSEKDFDAGMFYHISYGIPYDRYFTAGLLEFDFYRALCKVAGHKGDLHRCTFYGSHAAGNRLRAAMRVGMSEPWPKTLEGLTGSQRMDGTALVEYLAPAAAWLKKQNEGRKCGW